MTTTEQKKAAARIKALLAKTVENGATEEEAFAAMQKAREMMDKYGLTKEAIEADAVTIGAEKLQRDNYKTFVIKDWMASEVARYCDCKVWRSQSEGTLTFFGTEQDRQFAAWLLQSLDLFVRNQTVRFMQAQNYAGGKGPWDKQKGFMVGCIGRINERLHRLSIEREQAARPSSRGKSLVVVKMQLVEKAFGDLNMRLHKTTTKSQKGEASAYFAGRSAGDRASFSRPVNGGTGVRAISG